MCTTPLEYECTINTNKKSECVLNVVFPVSWKGEWVPGATFHKNNVHQVGMHPKGAQFFEIMEMHRIYQGNKG